MCGRARSSEVERARFRGLGKLERALLAARGEYHEQGGGEERAYHARIMTESEFHRAVDAVLSRIEAAVEREEDLDVELESGILTITCPDESRVIVNRQTPNREIWVAARSGGFHFRFADGRWSDTRSGEDLFATIARVVAAQSGAKLAFD
jgi:CyaY protein